MGPRHYRHIKSGGTYRIIWDDARIEATNTRAVIYQNVVGGAVWVRPYAEFFEVFPDGSRRFELIR